MRFDYLWDDVGGVLLVRFSSELTASMVGLLISADVLDGRTWPLLSVAFSRAGRDDRDAIVLYVPLPDAGLPDGVPIHLTVEPVCEVGYDAVPADRLALVRGKPAPGASVRYWVHQTDEDWTDIDVADQAPAVAGQTEVLCSHRRADTIYPVVPLSRQDRLQPVTVTVTLANYDGGSAHALRVVTRDGAAEAAVVDLRALPAAPDCLGLLGADHLSRPLPAPWKSLPLPRNPREALEFRVHAGKVDVDRQGATEPVVLQYLDRLVLSVRPQMPIRLVLDDRPAGTFDGPLVLVDLGGGSLAPDKGLLHSRVGEKLSVEQASGPLDVGQEGTGRAIGPFVETVRRWLVERISSAFPAAANLRPVHADALRAQASLYQTLAFLDLGGLDGHQRATIRQALSRTTGEVAALRHLCKLVVQAQMQQLLSDLGKGKLSEIDSARIDAWVVADPDMEKRAVHHCIAVLGWDQTARLLLDGLRPDPSHLVGPSEVDLDRWQTQSQSRFAGLHALRLLDAGAQDVLADVGAISEAAARIEQDWQRCEEVIESVQTEIGFHPPVTLEALITAQPVARPERLLLQALRDKLSAGLGLILPVPVVQPLAMRLSSLLASALNDDFRTLLSIVQRNGLQLPAFFEPATGIADASAPFAPSILLPSAPADGDGLTEWLTPRIEDKQLVRTWKSDLRQQIARRPPPHSDELRRPV
jgi:hypothetical protein